MAVQMKVEFLCGPLNHVTAILDFERLPIVGETIVNCAQAGFSYRVGFAPFNHLLLADAAAGHHENLRRHGVGLVLVYSEAV